MRFYLSLLFVFLYISSTLAAVTVKQGSSYLSAERLSAPNSQITKLSDKSYLIETGSQNWLSNPDFEASTITGWTSGGTGAALSSEVTNVVSGSKALNVTWGSGTYTNDESAYSNLLTYGKDLTGVNIQGSIWIRNTNGYSGISVCLNRVSSGGTLEQQSCTSLKTDNTWYKYTNYVPGGSSTAQYYLGFYKTGTVSVGSPQTIYADNAYLGLERDLTAGTTPNTYSAIVNSAGNVTALGGSQDWITASCTISPTGTFTCPVKSGLFSVGPSCVATLQGSSSADQTVARVTAASTTSVVVNTTTGAGTGANIAFNLVCVKQGADFVQPAIVPNTPASPTIQRFTSGSGTYTTPSGVKFLRIKMVGAGGGGAGSGTGGAGSGGTGGDSTFGSSLLTAGGGGGGTAGGTSPPNGGTNTVNAGPITILNIGGASGYGSFNNSSAAATTSPGGNGGVSVFGGAGAGRAATSGGATVANTGSGGAGGGNSTTSGLTGGVGGGAGGYVEALIASPAATYAYSVGAAGTAGTAGTSGSAGTAGSAGVIIVEEYYGTERTPLLLGSMVSSESTSTRPDSSSVTCSSSSSLGSPAGELLSAIGNISSGACTLTFKKSFNTYTRCWANYNSTSSAVVQVNVGSITTTGATLKCVTHSGSTTSNCTSVTADVFCLGAQ